MVFKLLQAAEGRCRAVNGPHLVALVRAGARFEAGELVERPDQTSDKEDAEGVDKVAA
jgi:putative transposase